MGNNAQGKTSILEALYLITQLKSFRSSVLQELVHHGAEESSVSVDLSQPLPTKILFGFSSKKKHLKIDDKIVAQRAKYPFLGTSVSFSPDDLSLVKTGPEARRDFLDSLSINLQPDHVQTYQQFQKLLSQRNRLLKSFKEGSRDFSSLELWTVAYVDQALLIYEIRKQSIQKLSVYLPEIYERLFSSGEEIELKYLNQFEGATPQKEAFLERLRTRQEAEIAVGYTLVGPHRDDLEIELGGLSAKAYGSQGQCRSLVIALKVAQLELTRAAQSLAPILLLDDIISELDESRVRSLVRYLAAYPGQLFLTSVEKEKLESLRSNFSDFQITELSQKPFRSPQKGIFPEAADLRFS